MKFLIAMTFLFNLNVYANDMQTSEVTCTGKIGQAIYGILTLKISSNYGTLSVADAKDVEVSYFGHYKYVAPINGYQVNQFYVGKDNKVSGVFTIETKAGYPNAKVETYRVKLDAQKSEIKSIEIESGREFSESVVCNSYEADV